MFHGQENNPGQHDDGREEAQDQIDAAGDELVSVRCEFLPSIGVLAVKDALAASIQAARHRSRRTGHRRYRLCSYRMFHWRKASAFSWV